MNNVLAAILGLASANLEIQPPGSPVHHAFEIISQAALRGGAMLKSLLSFARTSPAEMREVDLNAVLRDEIALLQHTTLAKVTLATDLADHLWPILGDACALSNALMNLCVNAVDAMPSPGTLTLQTRNLSRDWIEVVVKDTGAGMPREVLDQALDPYFTTKEVGKGTGLGLPLVYSTVRAHGGEMEIHSKVGEGTRVKMRFPASAPALHAPAPLSCHEASPQPASRTLLLVDDDELIRSSMKTILAHLGHRVTVVSSGEAALTALEAGLLPDLVLLDMNMPGLGGVGTLPRLRALLPTVPVLLSTGRADQAALDLIQAHPGVRLLCKPFSHEELKHHLDRLQDNE
jgi:CheY-like chemotaxis protein/anti-sigma regulatory factor (Ser/Thr protein kinase)